MKSIKTTEISRIPLNHTQLLFIDNSLLSDSSKVNRIGYGVVCEGECDEVRWQQSIEKLSNENCHLSACLEIDDDESKFWRVHRGKAARIRYRQVDDVDLIAATQSCVREPFDPTSENISNYTLIKTTNNKFSIVFSTHHALLDGYGMVLHAQNLFEIYNQGISEAPSILLPDRLSFEDQVCALITKNTEFNKQFDSDETLSHWRWMLRKVCPIYENNEGDNRKITSGFSGYDEYALDLDSEYIRKIKSFSRSLNITPGFLLKWLFGYVLDKKINTENVDFLVWEGFHGRGRKTSKDLSSYAFLLPNVISPKMSNYTIQESIASLKQQQRQSKKYRYISHRKIQEIIPNEKNRIIYNFNDFLPDLTVEGKNQNVVFPGPEMNQEISLYVHVLNDKLHFKFGYPSAIKGSEDFLEYYMKELDLVLTGAMVPLDKKGDVTDTFVPSHHIMEHFEFVATAHGDRNCLVDRSRNYCYSEVQGECNRIARALECHGVKKGDRVGVQLPKSVEQVTVMLSVMLLGAVYVPIDIFSPERRCQFIEHDADVALSIVEDNGRKDEDIEGCRLRINVSDLFAKAGNLSNQRFSSDLNHNDLLYIIYTSGTTGTPKGTPIRSDQLSHLIYSVKNDFDFDENDRWIMFHSPAFDFSMWEIWGALWFGASLLVLSDEESRNSELVYSAISKFNITVFNQTASAFSLFEKEDSCRRLPLSLRWIVFGGEAVSFPTLANWYERHGEVCQLVNMYGLTESTIHTTFYPIVPEDVLNNSSIVGKPLDGIELVLLDDSLMPTPRGEVGEAYISGDPVLEKYWKRPDLEAIHFLNIGNEYIGQRLYRTGDMMSLDKNGRFNYHGRKDRQIKYRGFRVELLEMEATLNRHKDISESAVICIGGENDKQIIAAFYSVLEAGTEVRLFELQEHMQKYLPYYMQPNRLYPVNELPRTINGKVDSNKLIEIAAGNGVGLAMSIDIANECLADNEKVLLEAVKEVLGFSIMPSKIDTLRSVGGDSMHAIQISGTLEEKGIELKPIELLKGGTFSSVSSCMRALANEMLYTRFSSISQQDRLSIQTGAYAEDAFPASDLQIGMIYQNELHQESNYYTDCFSHLVKREFNEDNFTNTFSSLISRHPALRSAFDLNTFDEPLQIVYSSVSHNVDILDLRMTGEKEKEEKLDEWWLSFVSYRIDYRKPPLYKLGIALLDDHTFRIGLSVHHAILDGWSVATFFVELLSQYASLVLPQKALHTDSRLGRWCLRRMEMVDKDNVERIKDLANLESVPTIGRVFSLEPSGERIDVISLGSSAINVLEGMAKSKNIGLKSLFFAVHNIAVSTISNSGYCYTGLSLDSRHLVASGESTLGLFVEAMPLVVDIKSMGESVLSLATFLHRKEFELKDLASQSSSTLYRRCSIREPDFHFNFVNFHAYTEINDIIELDFDNVWYREKTNFPLVSHVIISPVDNSATVNIHSQVQNDRANLVDSYSVVFCDVVESLTGITLEPVPIKPQPSLTRPLQAQSVDSYRAPLDCDYWVFNVVKQAWATVFTGENITSESHFFELGGDSLQLMQIIGQIEMHTEQRLGVKSCFENPRLSDQVTLLEMAILEMTDESELLDLMKG